MPYHHKKHPKGPFISMGGQDPTPSKTAQVELDGTPLCGVGAIAWQFTSGTEPFTTVFQVPNDQWGELKDKMGQPLTLHIIDARGIQITISSVFILHVVESDSPNRTSFLVADRRWMWAYSFISRDYNVTKKLCKKGKRLNKN